MTDIVELERRVTALECEMKAERRDLLRMLGLQATTLDHLDELNRRVIANELVATANARTTERGFADVNGRLDRVESEVGQVKAEVGNIKADVAALRRELPGLIAETMREVLRETRK